MRNGVCRKNAPKEVRHKPKPIHDVAFLSSNNLSSSEMTSFVDPVSPTRGKTFRMLYSCVSSQIEYVHWDGDADQRGDDEIKTAMIARRTDQGEDDYQHGADNHSRGGWHSPSGISGSIHSVCRGRWVRRRVRQNLFSRSVSHRQFLLQPHVGQTKSECHLGRQSPDSSSPAQVLRFQYRATRASS